MSESQTPRTDAAERDQEDRAEYRGCLVPARFARKLETELTATRARLAELEGIAEALLDDRQGSGFYTKEIAALKAYKEGKNKDRTVPPCTCLDLDTDKHFPGCHYYAIEEGKK